MKCFLKISQMCDAFFISLMSDAPSSHKVYFSFSYANDCDVKVFIEKKDIFGHNLFFFFLRLNFYTLTILLFYVFTISFSDFCIAK